MLNRLFIVVGLLAILAIGAAFVVPQMIDWSTYRERMQAIASEVLGEPVEIVGDIQFALLPQPQLGLSEIRIGSADAPVVTIERADAQFSLLDFLRDRYLITRLVLQKPAVKVGVDADGRIDIGIALAEQVTTSNVSVASAEIVDGAITLSDARSGDTFMAGNVDGELRMDAVRGPFAFQGSGEHEGRLYTARIGTSALDDLDQSQLSLFIAPEDEAFSLNAEGLLTTGDSPSLSGSLTYRQAPPPALAEGEEEDIGRGDLVVTGKLEATPARVLLTDYVITPDENRGATRLTGAAEITLGAGHAFNAVISGGVLALPPRDATADPAGIPYEFVRLLDDLPVPPLPPIPGTIGVGIAEVDLRAFALRDVRFDALASADGWTISSFTGKLPGDATLSLTGTLNEEAGRPNFAGKALVTTRRLDALAALWRRPDVGSPLFNAPGAFAADLALVGETLSLSNATLTVDQATHAFTAEIGFEPATRHLNLRAALGTLTAQQSRELLALLPEIGSDGQFAVTFPKGRFDLSADELTLGALAGTQLSAKGSWEGGVLSLDELSATDLGGMGIKAKLTAFGTLARPEVSGTAEISVASAGSPAMGVVFDTMGMPASVRRWLEGSLPASLSFSLDAPTGEGEQGLKATGQLGAAEMTLNATLDAGIARALSGRVAIRLELESEDPAALTAQLGLGSVGVFPDGTATQLVAIIDGIAANSFETTVRLEGGGESLGFSGNVIASNLEAISGNGNLRVSMKDFAGLAEAIGIGGIWVPPVEGSARIDFSGFDDIRISGIEAASSGERFTGELRWVRTPETNTITGELAAGKFNPGALLALLAGPAATITSDGGYWPDGPAAVGDAARRVTGRIAVTTPAIITGTGEPLVTDGKFELAWDATNVRVRDFTGAIGGGAATADITVCCAGPIGLAQVTARIGLDKVDFASLVPKPVADAVSATVSAGARFEGTGDSLLSALQAMTAEGSYTFENVSVAGLAPAAFDAIASLEAVLEMEPAAVTRMVMDSLDDSRFSSPSVSGGFTIAGGVLRSPNVAVEGTDARLFGSTTLRLADLSLGGGFVMSPTKPSGPDGMLTEANAQVAANFGGTLPAPQSTFDVSAVVDTIMVRAFEMEVARLEEIRAEDEARQRAAAAERERVAAEVAARRAAEEEARRAEEEAAAQAAAEQAAAEEAAAEQQGPPAPVLQPGFNLDLPPTF